MAGETPANPAALVDVRYGSYARDVFV